MNQTRIKVVFILVFLGINLFLGYLLYQSQWRETSISEQAVSHAVSVLQERNVLLDKALIPRNSQKMREVSVKNLMEDSSDFIAALIAEGWEQQEAGLIRGEEIFLFSDGRLEYRGRLYVGDHLSGDALSQEVGRQLKRLHFKEMKLKTVEQIEGGTVLNYVQTYDGAEVFGTELIVRVENHYLVSLFGIWTEPVNLHSKKQNTLFATEALMRFAQEEDRPPVVRVTEIRRGYYISDIDENIAHKVMQMLPVFQITTSSGAKFYYDARRE